VENKRKREKKTERKRERERERERLNGKFCVVRNFGLST
jgi:hypothetical protein